MVQVRPVRSRRPSEAQRRSVGVRAAKALERTRGAPTTRFKRIMEYARILARLDPEALPLLITALGRIPQSQAILEPVLHRRDAGSCYTSGAGLFDLSFPLDAEGRNFRDVAVRIKNPRRVVLKRDVVLPWPWRRARLANAMRRLRPRGLWAPWRQDHNHQVELWEPIGVGWSHGGNHSMAVGILLGVGTVRPNIAYDITPVYEHVYCDGRTFRRRHDRAVISEVASIELAAIFEIGRLIADARAGRIEASDPDAGFYD